MWTIIKHWLVTGHTKSHLSFRCFHRMVIECALLHADTTFQCQYSVILMVGKRQPESSDSSTGWVREQDSVAIPEARGLVILLHLFMQWMGMSTKYFLKELFSIFREREREEERGREKQQCARESSIGCLLPTSKSGPGPQPRHVPRLGIKPAAFQFIVQCSTHWATPARDRNYFWQVMYLECFWIH